MPLTSNQRAALTAEAKRRGVDPAALIREAEALSGDGGDERSDEGEGESKASAPEKTDKPLYMYHLPFVTVNEVRTIWLGLDPIAGGEKIASKWAAEQTGATSPAQGGGSPPDDAA